MAITPVHRVDVPVGVTDGAGRPAWGSDVVLDMLRLLDVEYAAVLPGSSFRGLHDSAVNYTANQRPELILCNHEMITVALAKGYARVAGRPMAAIVHNFVGLLNTAMTIYDAWCDRTPVLILGGTGPVDAARRRPRIDWIHTANVQGSMFRDFTKWDDQPSSVAAIPESLLRAYRIATSEPAGPVYVCFDVDLQEQALTEPFTFPDVARYRPAPTPAPDPVSLHEAARLLINAEMPVCFADRAGKDVETVERLVELAELLGMPVCNFGARWSFPTPHPLDFAGMQGELLAQADVLLALDMVDLAGALGGSSGHGGRARGIPTGGHSTRVIHVSLDELLARGFTTDYQALPTVDVPILSDAASTLPLLLEMCRNVMDSSARNRAERRRQALAAEQEQLRARQRRYLEANWDHPQISEARLAAEVFAAVQGEDYIFTQGRVAGMAPGAIALSGPDQHTGEGGGGAVGAGPGVALGAALALQGSGKLPVGIFGDGDFLSANQALWTAAHYRIPSLWVLKNNRSYYNDENHQDIIAQVRERPVENKVVAMRLENPEIDFAAMARTFGVAGEGPVTEASQLAPTLQRAVEQVKAGQLVVVDVRVENRDRG